MKMPHDLLWRLEKAWREKDKYEIRRLNIIWEIESKGVAEAWKD